MNELRLAARDFVTDPGTQSVQVGEAATALSEVLKKTRLELAPEQQDMIDGVTERLATYRSGIERISTLINRRAEMIVALPPLREKFDAAIAESADPASRVGIVSDPEPDRLGAAGAQSIGGRTGRAKHAVDDDRRSRRCAPRSTHYADAIIAHIDPRAADRRYRQGGAGYRGPPDPARHRIVARGQRRGGATFSRAISRGR